MSESATPSHLTFTFGQYLSAVHGLAMYRTLFRDPAAGLGRMDDLAFIAGGRDEFPSNVMIELDSYEINDGYDIWSQSYDGPNPAIEAEEPIVHRLLSHIQPGVALDVACGTGRHVAFLDSCGHSVIGVDANASMLDVARAKVPRAEFRMGEFVALPVADATVDVITCSLALTHIPELAPAIREMARVLKPGGIVVLSDIHPHQSALSGVAMFKHPGATGLQFSYVDNLYHPVSEYVMAFVAAGLAIEVCEEVVFDEALLQRTTPAYQFAPESVVQAFIGMPFLLIWQLRKV